MNKAVIFDWSGTLSDNFYCFYYVCKNMFIELDKKPINKNEIRLNFTQPYMQFWHKYFPNLDKDKQDKLYEKYIHLAGDPKIYKHVKIIFNYLDKKGFKLFIVSSDWQSKLIPEIKKSGLENLIKKTICEVHDKKIAISSLVKEFNLDKKQSFYMGDTSGDVEAGRKAGIKTIGITWGFQHEKILAAAKPDFLINDIIKIKTIL